MPGRKLEFEIHITVSQTNEDKSSEFAKICPRFGGKAVFIELARGEFQKQLMLSKNLSGDFARILKTAHQDAENLALLGFKAQRIKIETPVENANLFEKSARQYFEWHGKVESKSTEKLLEICRRHNAHLSRNALKIDTARRFITIREAGERQLFEDHVERLIIELEENEWQVSDRHTEFCVYDNNLPLDNGWLEK